MIGAVNAATTQRKVVIKESVNIAVGQNNIETIDIAASRIISITGVVHYKAGYVLPLSYPMLNYGNGGYIEWGISAVIKGNVLQLISGAEWRNCDIKVVIEYI
jgi:hypothetical protein|uniref:Uncharacterized protein n=1 Tax=Podoviridae sp. ctTSE2 TaxID=2825251 RepID=A0A8S5Q4Q2_9CAUD|nr:MAG TPA: hypothetical protein [Podoviridae sp. ctTSE2]